MSQPPVNRRRGSWGWALAGAVAVGALFVVAACAEHRDWTPYNPDPQPANVAFNGVEANLNTQTQAMADARSTGCTACHKNSADPHPFPAKHLACVDCHGGDGLAATKEAAHPKPRHPERWPTAANPEHSYTLLNEESVDWIQFVNPGDLRVANTACGGCHRAEVLNVSKSMMTTASHFLGTAAYSNGIVSQKQTIFGESYSPEGVPQQVNTVPKPTAAETRRGVIETVVPLPQFEITQPGNVFRVFEKGSRLPNPSIGLPDKAEDSGRPNNRLSDRGLGSLNRVDLPLLNVHKTRLNDPHLSFLGTNDNPGDYRSSGCTACHVVYANDRTPAHSGPYARFGNTGTAGDNPDPTIVKGESGHPIAHKFTSGPPSSQCMVCHMHQPNSFVNTYYGFQMWTYETDGEKMWPPDQVEPTANEIFRRNQRNPEGAAVRGKWGDPEFLKNVSDMNPALKHTQFADYHGHGWVFRAVFKTDRKGNLLDRDGAVIPYDSPDKFAGVVPRDAGDGAAVAAQPSAPVEPAPGHAVHLKDIHAEYGMHCVDCHFQQDVHGDGRLYSEYQSAITIGCKDCHGTVSARSNLVTSGPAAAGRGQALVGPKTPFTDAKTNARIPRFERRGTQIIQHSMVNPGVEWKVKQVLDSVNPGPEYNEKAAYAKLQRRGGGGWDKAPARGDKQKLAHGDDDMECYACHTAWVTSCFGCHLPQKANYRSNENHFDGNLLRNYATYNPQVARDDVFLLGKAGDSKQNKVSTVRSSSAVMISSEDGQRRKIYAQQPTVAADGHSSQAFNTHFAHTVRKKETRSCDDCHVSAAGDNNAWLAQTYLLGTNYVNFIGYRAWVGCGSGGLEAVRVTEWEEPQAVIGSRLHEMAYPKSFADFVGDERELKDVVHHGGSDVRSVVVRGEYAYAALGEGGFRAFDVANVNNKDFSEPIVTAPVSPLGQDTHISTRFATAVAFETNNATSMARTFRPENREQNYPYAGRDQYLHESYRYAYVTDRYEGLILVDVDMLTDGDPQNNFIRRAVTFNPDGILDGAENLAVAGSTVYVCCKKGIVAVSVEDPLNPVVLATVGAPAVANPRAIAVQFRYAFVADDNGVAVLDVTWPEKMHAVPGAVVPVKDARDIFVARTYAYVSAGAEGLVILDVEKPEHPTLDQVYNADGAINDLYQVKVGMTNDSSFAYLADGKNGLRIVQLVTPDDGGRSAYGFAPRPKPRMIATSATGGPAVAVAKGLDRDRAVDESGHQMAVFGRIGGRPFTLEEMRRLFIDEAGHLFSVTNRPSTPSRK